MRKIALSILIILATSAMAGTYSPANVPNPLETRSSFVSNPDGILSASDAAAIDQIAMQLYRSAEVELAVVAVESIGQYEAADFVQELFNRWGVGAQGKNTGVMILLAVESRDIRIQTGGGMEGLLPDATCEAIVQEQMIPELSQAHWGTGLRKGAEAIQQTCMTDEALAELLLGYTPKSHEMSDFFTGYLMVAFLLLMLLSTLVYNDFRRTQTMQHEQRLQLLKTSWLLTCFGAIFFPLPILWLYRWYKRHGGKEVQAQIDKATREQQERNRRNGRGGGSNVFFGPGFGGGHRGGGFGGGMPGGFGGGVSFGGGAGGKF